MEVGALLRSSIEGQFGRLLRSAIMMAMGAAFATPAMANPPSSQIVVSVSHIKALDKFDELSLGDIFIKATIAGKTQYTPTIKQKAAVGVVLNPNWLMTESVEPGIYPVRIELIDKDVTKDDVIDINRLPNRRMLEFTVDTRRCHIDGFVTRYNCGSAISRSGKEPKAAEISFTVDVKPITNEISSR